MGLTLITTAATLPVSLAEVRTACRIEDGRFDALLTQKLRGAVKHIEKLLGIALGEQTWRLTLDQFSDAIELPKGPVLGLVTDGFQYIDSNGDAQLVAPEAYVLDLLSSPAWIVRNEDQSWPTTQDRINAVQIDFETGWTAETLPDDLKEAILMTAAAWFDGEGGTIPSAAMNLLHPHRRLQL